MSWVWVDNEDWEDPFADLPGFDPWDEADDPEALVGPDQCKDCGQTIGRDKLVQNPFAQQNYQICRRCFGLMLSDGENNTEWRCGNADLPLLS